MSKTWLLHICKPPPAADRLPRPLIDLTAASSRERSPPKPLSACVCPVKASQASIIQSRGCLLLLPLCLPTGLDPPGRPPVSRIVSYITQGRGHACWWLSTGPWSGLFRPPTALASPMARLLLSTRHFFCSGWLLPEAPLPWGLLLVFAPLASTRKPAKAWAMACA